MLSLFIFTVSINSYAFFNNAPVDKNLFEVSRNITILLKEDKKPILDESLITVKDLQLFYKKRLFVPAWINGKGISNKAYELINILNEAEEEGLYCEQYHLKIIAYLLKEIGKDFVIDPYKLAQLDLLLTDSFILYSSNLFSGVVNSETLSSTWSENKHEMDYGAFLEQVLLSGKIADKLQKLLPFSPDYALLRSAYRKYRKISRNGGWPILPTENIIKKGDVSATVSLLRKRLEIEHYLKPETPSSNVFDNELENALKEIQLLYGFEANGILDYETINALNVSSYDRAQQISLNMERWRWLPQDLGSSYVLINIADYMLYVIKKREIVLKMKAIVGRHYRQTPLVYSNIIYCVFNPDWNVPYNIAVKDLLPKIKQNPRYLAKNNFKVFRQSNGKVIEINPQNINWNKVNSKNFYYTLQQQPGQKNALGKIKFIFPNKYDVYIHDTPEKEFFKRNTRAFSSGCIRIEKPFELAQYLLSDKQAKKWSKHEISTVINRGIQQFIAISPPIPVHVIYWTAWINRDGSVNFRDDIYQRDAGLKKAIYEIKRNNQ